MESFAGRCKELDERFKGHRSFKKLAKIVNDYFAKDKTIYDYKIILNNKDNLIQVLYQRIDIPNQFHMKIMVENLVNVK